jgi:hypothetical protein
MAFTSWLVVRSTAFTSRASPTLNPVARRSSSALASAPKAGTSLRDEG